jgi:hypothetical protein
MSKSIPLERKNPRRLLPQAFFEKTVIGEVQIPHGDDAIYRSAISDGLLFLQKPTLQT